MESLFLFLLFAEGRLTAVLPKIVFVICMKSRKRKEFAFYIDKIILRKYNQIHNKTI